MGQVALGFRSLLIKLAVFVVMAALLAWALGGTLWPRAEIIEYEPVSYAGNQYRWRLSVGGRDDGRVRWQLVTAIDGEEFEPLDERSWDAAAGPVVTDAGFFYAGRPSPSNPGTNRGWVVVRLDQSGQVSSTLDVPDRLAAERQLERVRIGMPLQDPDTIRNQRPVVLDPPAAEGPTQGSES